MDESGAVGKLRSPAFQRYLGRKLTLRRYGTRSQSLACGPVFSAQAKPLLLSFHGHAVKDDHWTNQPPPFPREKILALEALEAPRGVRRLSSGKGGGRVPASRVCDDCFLCTVLDLRNTSENATGI